VTHLLHSYTALKQGETGLRAQLLPRSSVFLHGELSKPDRAGPWARALVHPEARHPTIAGGAGEDVALRRGVVYARRRDASPKVAEGPMTYVPRNVSRDGCGPSWRSR
jgi:hypothetical protein